MYCPNCGKENKKEMEFCRFCKKRLPTSSPPTSMQRKSIPSIAGIILGITVLSCFFVFSVFWYMKTVKQRKNSFTIHAVFEVERFQEGEKSLSELTDKTMKVLKARLKFLGGKAVVQKEGEKRILVDLKWVRYPEIVLNILGMTAYLEFKLVEDNPDLLKAAMEGKIPDGYQLIYEYEKDAKGMARPGTPFLVQAQPNLTGQDLSNARMSYSQGALPVVDLELNSEGAKKFADVTGANIGKRLAIVLDGIVQSAPVIKDRIPSGRAQISGRFTTQEAKDLALVLQAGALPAKLKLVSQQVLRPK